MVISGDINILWSTPRTKQQNCMTIILLVKEKYKKKSYLQYIDLALWISKQLSECPLSKFPWQRITAALFPSVMLTSKSQ